jgi:hypothetical protein
MSPLAVAKPSPVEMQNIADAIRVLSGLLGPHFTGQITLHFRRGEFQHLELPPPTIRRDELPRAR